MAGLPLDDEGSDSDLEGLVTSLNGIAPYAEPRGERKTSEQRQQLQSPPRVSRMRSAPAAPAPPPLPEPQHLATGDELLIQQQEAHAEALLTQGRVLEALKALEQGVALRVALYGGGAAQTTSALERVALLYNSEAMDLLAREEQREALRLLRKAEELCGTVPALAAAHVQTLNNLACCYRRMARPKNALSILRKSLELCDAQNALDGIAVTHLNVCAVLSQLGEHEEALEHAQAAVLHCQEQLLSDSIQEKLGEHSQEEQHTLLTERIVVLGIAYHNLGVEEEHLGRYKQCLQWYQKAVKLTTQHIGADEHITQTFRASYEAAKKLVDAGGAGKKKKQQRTKEKEKERERERERDGLKKKKKKKR